MDGGHCSARAGSNLTSCDATGAACGRGADCPPDPALLSRGGLGNLTAYTGMTWVGFRPSDNECGKYNVPVRRAAESTVRQNIRKQNRKTKSGI